MYEFFEISIVRILYTKVDHHVMSTSNVATTKGQNVIEIFSCNREEIDPAPSKIRRNVLQKLSRVRRASPPLPPHYGFGASGFFYYSFSETDIALPSVGRTSRERARAQECVLLVYRRRWPFIIINIIIILYEKSRTGRARACVWRDVRSTRDHGV